jgi:hypothetical protein
VIAGNYLVGTTDSPRGSSGIMTYWAGVTLPRGDGYATSDYVC